MKPALFRWKAIGALAAVLLVLAVLWAIFGDWLVKLGTESVATEVLGTEVDIGSLRIRETRSAVELGRLEIANPFDSTKNLLEAGKIVIDLEALPFFEKKVVADRMIVTDLRFKTTRRRPARSYASRDGVASRLLSETEAWAKKVQVPLLSLTPIDTIKSIVLDPTSLATIKAVEQLTRRADSVKGAFEQSLAHLHLQSTIDSTKALAKRLAATKPGTLGVAGTAQAVQSAKRGIDEINQAKQQVVALEQSAPAAARLLTSGVQGVDSARRQDYEFAKGLLKLPQLDAPSIGAALFGSVSVDRFQQALYWARLAQEYIPPGLQPWRRSGPVRARMAGTTYTFPREHTDPTFLLRNGELSFGLGGDSPTSRFSGTVTGLTTEPALYARPATLKASGSTTGRSPLSADVGALLDHTKAPVHDSAQVRLKGLRLPSFDLPGLPFGVSPGVGSSEITLEIMGDQIAGRWSMRSSEAVWHADSAKALNTLEGVLWRVLSGLNDLQVTAEVRGDLASPRLSVSSNIDQAVAARLREIVGEELAKAEAKARAAVDRLIADKVEPVTRQVASVQSILDQRLGGSKTQLDQVQKQLERELKRLGGPGGLIPLPNVRP